jgi:multidrug efflux system membrane fusion protein
MIAAAAAAATVAAAAVSRAGTTKPAETPAPMSSSSAPGRSTSAQPTSAAQQPAANAPSSQAEIAAAAAAAATLAAATVARAAQTKAAPAPAQRPEPIRKEPAPVTTETVRTETVPKRGGFGWLLWLLVAVVVIAGALFAFFHFHQSSVAGAATGGGTGGKGKHSDMPRVVTAVATTGDIPVYITGLGAVTPLNTVTVQSRVSGQLMKVLYTEGQMVKENQLLLQIDSRPFVAVLDQDNATLEHDEALLENALIDLQRYQTLWAQNSIPQQTLATQASLVKQDQGTVDSDKAQVEAAQLNITYCNITSPIDGRVGLRLVDVGNYVQATSSSGLVVITQIQPITVIFTIAEDSIDAVTTAMKGAQPLEVDAYARGGFTQKLSTGTLLTIDNQIDPTTGTVKLRAAFPNLDNALFPNQFVNARMLVDTRQNVVIVPVAAVQHDSSNNTFVYILDTSANTVKMQSVTVGTTSFDQTQEEITKGVTAGETVVTDGVDKLQDGSKVIVSKPVENSPGTAGATPAAAGGTTADGTSAADGTTPASAGSAPQHQHKKKKTQGDDSTPPAS